MTVTKKPQIKLKDIIMQAAATRIAKFEDYNTGNPLPEVFESEEAYNDYAKDMYALIVDQYTEGRNLISSKDKAERERGNQVALGVLEDVEQIRLQLGLHYPRFQAGLRAYAIQRLGEVKTDDLMESLRNAEKALPAVDRREYDNHIKEKGAHAEQKEDNATEEEVAQVKRELGQRSDKDIAEGLDSFFGAD
jgi:hypothetical protein